jgi:hypothetical protein
MKIIMEVECTPEEARRFLGLPDVAPLQEAVMAKWQENLTEVAAAASPEALLRAWMPFASNFPESMLNAMKGGLKASSPAEAGTPRRSGEGS